METNFKGTKGIYIINESEPIKNEFGVYGTDIGTENVTQMITVWQKDKYPNDSETEEIELIIEALNVRQKVNCSLTDLLQQRNELLEALIEAKKILDSSPIKFSDVNAKVENAIKKATL